MTDTPRRPCDVIGHYVHKETCILFDRRVPDVRLGAVHKTRDGWYKLVNTRGRVLTYRKTANECREFLYHHIFTGQTV